MKSRIRLAVVFKQQKFGKYSNPMHVIYLRVWKGVGDPTGCGRAIQPPLWGSDRCVV